MGKKMYGNSLKFQPKWKCYFSTLDKYVRFIWSIIASNNNWFPLSPIHPLSSHQQHKHQEVAGQQALKMLITHTTAKHQGSKGAHSHYQPPHMCLHSQNGFVCEVSFLPPKLKVYVCANMRVTPQTVILLKTLRFQISLDDTLPVFQ